MQPAASGRGKPMMNDTIHMMMSQDAWTTTAILKYYSFGLDAYSATFHSTLVQEQEMISTILVL